MKATISVAMCTYNGARFLEEQLDSIAAQCRLPDELVVCDDGSNDGTVEIVKHFAERAVFPVRFCRNQKTLGSTRNFENAISLCRGDLIALCDQDDIWLSEKLSRMAAILEADPSLGGVFSDADLIDEQSHLIGKRLWQVHRFGFSRAEEFDRRGAMQLLLKHDVVTGATLMCRSPLREFIVPIPEIWVHDGWIAWMLVLYSRLTFVGERLVRYRVHPAQQLGVGHSRRSWRDPVEDRDKLENMAQQFEKLRERWIGRPGNDYAACLATIDEKISFLRHRRELPQGFAARAWSVLRSSGMYERYGRGLSSMRGDLLLGPCRGDLRA